MRPVIALTLVLSFAQWGFADEKPVRRVGLRELVDKAKLSARGRLAHDQLDSVKAKQSEVHNLWIPQLEITAVGGPGPSIKCNPSPEMCVTTTTSGGTPITTYYTIGDQPTYNVQASVTMPLYTFGKLSHAGDAIDEAVKAAHAGVEITERDLAQEAVRGYYGLKLGRELLLMLDEGHDKVAAEIARIDEHLKAGKTDVSEYDLYRMRALTAEIEARQSEVQKLVDTGLGTLRILYGDDTVDIDEAPLAEIPMIPLGTPEEAREDARSKRAERRAVKAGVRALEHVATVEERGWLPDLVLRASATVAHDPGADTPQNAFYNNPLNVEGFGVLIALHWAIDGTRPAKVRQARIEVQRMKDNEAALVEGLGNEGQSAWQDAKDARRRLEATRAGEKAAHQWLVAVLQNTAVGTAEPRDVNEALQAWFIMHGRVLQATFDWNVAVIWLARTAGRDWQGYVK